MPESSGGLAALLASLKSPDALRLVAAAAGAILSLSFIDRLTLRGRAVAVAQGFLTAVFVAPMVTTGVAHVAPFLGHVEMGVHFLLSLSSMAVLPPLLEYMRKRAADPFAGWGGFIGTFLRRAPSAPGAQATER